MLGLTAHNCLCYQTFEITSQYKAREHDDDQARAKQESAIDFFYAKPRRKLSGPRFSNALETCLFIQDKWPGASSMNITASTANGSKSTTPVDTKMTPTGSRTSVGGATEGSGVTITKDTSDGDGSCVQQPMDLDQECKDDGGKISNPRTLVIKDKSEKDDKRTGGVGGSKSRSSVLSDVLRANAEAKSNNGANGSLIVDDNDGSTPLCVIKSGNALVKQENL